MDKSNSELFKQAISEGLCNRFDKIAASFTDEVVCSEGHILAMRTIVYGKASGWRSLSPRKQRIIAILIAAALLLTSCAVIFRNEIREIFGEISVAIFLSDRVGGGELIEEFYELSYVPEGYRLEKESINSINADYIFTNEHGEMIRFQQGMKDGAAFIFDTEGGGYSEIINICGYEVYYRYTGEKYNYIWNVDKYSMHLKTDEEFSIEEIKLIIEGIKVK